jgi:hypothetical protein
MTEWSNERQNLEHMRMSAMLMRAANGNKPYPEADNLIATIEDEIYYQQVRDRERDELDDALNNGPNNGSTPENMDIDGLRTVKIGSRTTTFRIDGRSVTFREFRLAAKKKGVDMEKRLKLDNKPERFVSRGEVRVEQ